MSGCLKWAVHELLLLNGHLTITFVRELSNLNFQPSPKKTACTRTIA